MIETWRIKQDPLAAELPIGDVASYIFVANLAAEATEKNFQITKQYVCRLEPKYQVLFLVIQARMNNDSRSKIVKLPEYADWLRREEIVAALNLK